MINSFEISEESKYLKMSEESQILLQCSFEVESCSSHDECTRLFLTFKKICSLQDQHFGPREATHKQKVLFLKNSEILLLKLTIYLFTLGSE